MSDYILKIEDKKWPKFVLVAFVAIKANVAHIACKVFITCIHKDLFSDILC